MPEGRRTVKNTCLLETIGNPKSNQTFLKFSVEFGFRESDKR
jgi:hypothetical protein